MQNNLLDTPLWFNRHSLEKLSDPAIWERGLNVYAKDQVLSMEIEAAGDSWNIYGEIQGSQRLPYEVTVNLSLTPDAQVASWRAQCTCPVGNNCKHSIALLLRAAHTTPAPSNQVEAQRLAAVQRAQHLAKMQEEAKLLEWLSAMDRATGKNAIDTTPPAAHGSYALRASDDRPEQYLYLLSVQGGQGPKPLLNIEAVVSYPKTTGGWAKPKPIKAPPFPGQAVYDRASETDRQVLQLIRAMPSTHHYRYAYNFSLDTVLEGQVGLITLEQAASTGRLFIDDGKGGAGSLVTWGAPIALDWQWQEVPSLVSMEPQWVLRAKLAGSHAKLCLNTPPLYLDSVHGRCGMVQAHGISPAQLSVLLSAPPLKAEALQQHQAALMQRLGPVPLPPVLQSLTELRNIAPQACLHIAPPAPDQHNGSNLLEARPYFDYAGHTGWWAGQGAAVTLDTPTGRFLLHRNLEAEFEAMTRLLDVGLYPTGTGSYGLLPSQSQQTWLQWAEDDFAHFKAAGFSVTVDPIMHTWITHADNLSVDLRAQGEEEATSPWFELSLGMEINGQRHNILPWLPDLIATAANSPLDTETGQPIIPPFLYLRDPNSSGFIRLPTESLKPWMAALLELVGDRSHNFGGDSLKLSRLDAMRTTASLGEGVMWEGATTLREMVHQLSGKTELPTVAVPTSVQASLRPYQQQGLNWLQFLRTHGLGGILADDMGLGKTLQTLTHIQVEKDTGRLDRPALIIAPVSLMGNWKREAERFCPTLRTLVLHGKERHDAAHTIAEHDLIIAPYSLLQRDKERWLETQWHIVVLDEAQNIKNASTHAAQVVGQLQTRHRLCLSGTPMENHLGEVWSLFHFLMPGFLGSQQRFKELFRTPIEKEGDPDRLTQLRARITPFMLRRTKALVASELPPKVETITRVELAGKQADLYETIRLGMEKTVREALSSKGLAKSQITILDALMKLRQVCCDPQLLDLPAAKKVTTSAKLEQLMTMLPEMIAEGRRILLFSQFTSMLSLIETELKQRDIAWVKLTGQSQKRDELIDKFTSGQVPLFLISLKAGGVGLNLPQADTVIHYDPWWNPAIEAQATDRAHRIGQNQSVFVYKLVAQGTIEERILALQERKATLAETIYSGSTERKQPLFTEGDLAELLRPLSE